MSNDRVASRRPAPINKGRRRNPSTRLRITTAHCPQVMLRVLDLLARQAVTPWVISYSRRPRTQFIEVQTDTLTTPASDTLVSRLESLVQVRSVRISRLEAGAER